MLVDPNHAGIIPAEHLGAPSDLSDRKHADAMGLGSPQPRVDANVRQVRRLALPISHDSPSQGFQVRKNGCLIDAAGFKGPTDLADFPTWDHDLNKAWLAPVAQLSEGVVLTTVNCEA